MEVKFYICRHCGNIVCYVKKVGAPIMCCGQKMEELTANTVEAAVEKHIPEVAIENGLVKVVVGSVLHPMTEAHLIEWVAVQTNKGVQIKKLAANDQPACEFALVADEKVECVYAYCNLHGLWKKEL